MKKEYPRLETFQLVRPCPINMDGLDPAEKENFCKSCNKKVYNLSVLSTDAAEALLEEKGNKACVMFMRSNDGRIVTDSCPHYLRPLRRCARIAINLTTLIILWILVQGKALAQGLVGAPIEHRWGCSTDPNCLPQRTPLEQLLAAIPTDERGLWTSGLSLLVAWCTWMALIAKAKSPDYDKRRNVSNSMYFLITMLVIIFAPALLVSGNAPAYSMDTASKFVLFAGGPLLALCFWLYKSFRPYPAPIGIDTIALAIAIPLTVASMSRLGTPFSGLTFDSAVRIAEETYVTYSFLGLASVLNALVGKKEPPTWSGIFVLLFTPPILAFTWEKAILDPSWLVPAVVALSSIAILFRQRMFATIAAALYAFPFMKLVAVFLLGGLGVTGVLNDVGYDTARDFVRCSTALALAFAFTAIWWHKIKHIKLTAQTIILLFMIPILVHLIGTFMINNFGGLGGGGL